MLTLIFLIILMVKIIVSTTKFKLHPYLTHLLAAMLMGFLGELDTGTVLSKLTKGFSNTLKIIGIVIS